MAHAVAAPAAAAPAISVVSAGTGISQERGGRASGVRFWELRLGLRIVLQGQGHGFGAGIVAGVTYNPEGGYVPADSCRSIG